MQLIPEWKSITKKAHSMRAFYLSFLALITPDVIYLVFERDTNPRVWFFVGLSLLVYGILGRLIDQGTSGGVRCSGFVTLAAFLAVAVPHVGQWEGKRNHAYLDRIASPSVWTICYGETRGVKAGDYRTDAECDKMLADGLTEYREALHGYFTPETLSSRLTPKRDTAYVSLAWNAGIRTTGRSTATRRLNAGDIRGGCTALGWWNKAGGRVIRGLVNRRTAEVKLCMVGLT